MSTSSTTFPDLNKYLKDNKDLFTLESFNNPNITTPTPTIILEDTILKYSPTLKILLCSRCSVNLTTISYIKHLKEKHKILYNSYKANNTLDRLTSKINSLEFNTLEDLKILLEPNRYYIRELVVLFNNYKCLECDFINIDRKNIRIHFNKIHSSTRDINNKPTIKRAYYIIENIPLQVLEGFRYNTKVYFIPKLPDNRLLSDEDTTKINPRPIYITSSTSNEDSSGSDSDYTSGNNRAEIAKDTKDLILESYKREKKLRDKNLLYTSSIEGNKRLLSSFITKSNILTYIRDKNRDLLINLAYRTTNSTNIEDTSLNLEERVPIDFNELDKAILEFLETSSSKINSINLLLRQRIKNSNINSEDRVLKDFIPLENKSTRSTYFTIFSRLIIFILKVYYIAVKLKDSTNKEEIEYYRIAKEIRFPDTLIRELKSIIYTKLDRLNIDENRIKFNYRLSRVFTELLKIPNTLSFTRDNTLNNIVIIFFYISSLDIVTGEIKPILEIGKLTSILIYNSRLVTIGYYYYREIREDIKDSKLESEIEEFIGKYLTLSSKNYFEFILTLRPYILSLTKEVISTNFLIIESKADIIEANSIEYPISTLKDFFKDIFFKLEDILLRKLLAINRIDDLGLDFNKISDTPLLKRVGESILDLESTRDLKYKPYFLRELLTPNTYYNKTLFKGVKEDKIIFKANTIEKFNTDINRFVEYLALAIYLFSGGPLRGTELTTLIFKNIESKDRSLLFDKDNTIFTITTDYYKSKNISRKEKLNIRYLPPLLSRILVVYILYIVPFKEYILKEVYNIDEASTPLLLVKDDKALSTNLLSRVLKRESSRFFNKGLTLSSYRKIINYIIKTKFDNNDYYSNSESDLSDRVEDKQSNRTTKTSYNHYFNIGSYFSNLNNVDSLTKIREFSFKYFDYFNLLDIEDIANNPRVSKAIKASIKGKSSTISSYKTLEVTTTTKDLERDIRLLYNNTKLGFRNKKQEEGLVNIISNIPVLTFINKTSSGKSLLYLLPSFIFKSKVYIIITPRITLTTNLYNKAKDLDLNPSTIKEPASINSNLYFINIEDLNTTELDTLIATFKRYNRDITIYIDEIHLFLLEASYRPKLKYFSTLLRFKANIVFLSATLPNTLLRILENTLNIRELNRVIRGSSNREDITYKRLYYKNNKEEFILLTNTLADIESRDKNIDNKILIFINNIKKGLDLEEKLGLDFIYSNKANKEAILEDFLAGRSRRAILTTSILEVGLDLPTIKYTINLDPIYSLTSIIQSSGRIRSKGTSFIITKEPNKYVIDSIRNNTIIKDEDNIDSIKDYKELDFYSAIDTLYAN